MKVIPDTELDARIHAFLDKKMMEFPDLWDKAKPVTPSKHRLSKLNQIVTAALFGLHTATDR